MSQHPITQNPTVPDHVARGSVGAPLAARPKRTSQQNRGLLDVIFTNFVVSRYLYSDLCRVYFSSFGISNPCFWHCKLTRERREATRTPVLKQIPASSAGPVQIFFRFYIIFSTSLFTSFPNFWILNPEVCHRCQILEHIAQKHKKYNKIGKFEFSQAQLEFSGKQRVFGCVPGLLGAR